MTEPFAMNSFRGKQVLALVRAGDYAHAGEEEAIELTLAEVPKDPARRLLDAGCGRGGTAAYMQRHGWGRVTGFDMEAQSIEGARAAYPEADFLACDILQAPRHLAPGFQLITLFNVLYALPDQAGALAALASVAAPGARLAIFDYLDPGPYEEDALADAGMTFLPRPPRRAELPALLAGAGWDLQDLREITEDYTRWYVALVAKIEAKREAIEALAGKDGHAHVLGLYSGLLARLEDGRLGGAIIYAGRSA